VAVYRRTYAAYSGTLTPEWSRFLVLFRYARRHLFKSRLQTALFVACFFFPLLCLAMIYLANNLAFLQRLGGVGPFVAIDNNFFFRFMNVQGVLAFLMTAFAGPGLISPDLANGALPLYFCRPFSRSEYVLGKASVLGILLSQITWIPGLVLLVVEASLAGPHWMWDHIGIAAALVVSSAIWITLLSLLAMALSAWVKWRIVAGALLLAVMFFGVGFGQAVNAVLRTHLGDFFNVGYLVTTIERALFQTGEGSDISVMSACLALLAYSAICLALLMKKVRAYEVVR
jgi:ABC-2 type transport system permease protein